MRTHQLYSILCLLAGASTLIAAPLPAPPAKPAPPTYPGHVRASLLSDVSNLRAGRAFNIGVLLEIEQGWHIYWTNPGDSGAPTVVSFKGPDGFDIVADPFPVPTKIRQGKETAYGYDRNTLFTARVTPPADLRIGDHFTFDATANWLVCKDECLPGSATTSLTMKVEGHTGPVNVDAFARSGYPVARAKDRPMEIAKVEGTFDAKTSTATFTIHWKTPCTGVQLYPAAVEGLTVGTITVKKTEDNLTPVTIKLTFGAAKHFPARLPVVMAFRDSDGHFRGWETGVPLH